MPLFRHGEGLAGSRLRAHLKSPVVLVEGFEMVLHGTSGGMHAVPEEPDLPAARLERGTKICVRNRFLGDWSTGFEVAAVLAHGYRIRRVSDGLTFPDVFPVAEVQKERRHDAERNVVGSYLDRQAD